MAAWFIPLPPFACQLAASLAEGPNGCVLNFLHSHFGFVSDFGF
jgi:hypothetical protein